MEIEITLDSITNINKNKNNVSEIDIISSDITYDAFFKKYMQNNVPCIIRNITNQWESSRFWIDSHNNKPNFAYLNNKYGSYHVTSYNCDKKYFNSHETETIKFSDYLDYFQNFSPPLSSLKYLKDWHLQNMTTDRFYQVPKYFSSDWLNEYLIAKCEDDYRFVYMGPTSTWTSFHADVFSSYSWSVNICGRKRWLLFPPGEETHLKDSLGNLPFDVGTATDNLHTIELIQGANEAIFVPSGWYHQVWNLDDTISINHNWVNGCNIERMWLSMVDNLDLVKKEISDCCEMDGFLDHCQVMLKASYGLDFFKFYDLLGFIARRRLAFLREDTKICLFDQWMLGRNHAKFDLKMLQLVLEKFTRHSDVNMLSCFKTMEIQKPTDLLTEIVQYCEKYNNV